jgi:cell division protein FtsB
MLKRQSTHNQTSYRVSARAILLATVAIIIFALLLSSVINLFIKYRSIRAHIKELKTQQVQLQQKKESVTAMNSYISTPEGKEEIFRDKYRLVRPGEGMIVITNDTPEDQPVESRPGIVRFWDGILRGLGLR